MNDILSELKKPLTERGWEKVDDKGIHHYRKIGTATIYDSIDARFQQAYYDQPALIARIEALEAERRWKERQLDVLHAALYEIRDLQEYNQIASKALEEYDLIEKKLPSPPDRAQERSNPL